MHAQEWKRNANGAGFLHEGQGVYEGSEWNPHRDKHGRWPGVSVSEREKRLYLEYKPGFSLPWRACPIHFESPSRAEPSRAEPSREKMRVRNRRFCAIFCAAPPSTVFPHTPQASWYIQQRRRGKGKEKKKRSRDPGYICRVEGATINIPRPFESIGEGNTIHCCTCCVHACEYVEEDTTCVHIHFDTLLFL